MKINNEQERQAYIKAMTSPEMEAKAQAAIAEIIQFDSGRKRASAEALPGPLKEAFSLVKDITVGQWRVRPFYDIDFEFFAALEHPLDRMYKDAVEGKEISPAQERAMLSGKTGWQAAWIMTRPIDEVEALLNEPNGASALNAKARAEFSRLQPKVLAQIAGAIMRQVAIASSTAVGYEEESETEVAKSAENPTSPLLQKTG